MLSRVAKRAFSSTVANPYKVTVLGAGGGIGQPLSLLLKLNHKVTDLRLYDLKGAKVLPPICLIFQQTPWSRGLLQKSQTD